MKNYFSVKECLERLPKQVPSWRYVSSIVNVGASNWPDDTDVFEKPNFHKQTRTVTHFLPDYAGEDSSIVTDLADIEKQHFDLAVCANVLSSSEDLDLALATLASVSFDACLIQINEGRKNGKGREYRSGYQRNEALRNYLRPIQQNFYRYDVTLHRDTNTILLTKGRRYFAMNEGE